MVLKTKNIFKLVTREDPNFIHKFFGISCLLNFIYQFAHLGIYGSMDLINNKHTPLLLVIHGGLNLSSLIFHVPLNRHKGAPMIYKEFRLHSIVFALRSVLCAFAFYYNLSIVFNIFIINLTMMAADLITFFFEADTKTMRGMPFGKDLKENEKKEVTNMHSTQQFGATAFMLTNIEGAFAPLLAIQIAAFLMTLVRKSIISELDWHRLYAISLWLNIFVYWSFVDNPILAFYVILGVYIFYYARITFRYNKYLIWNCIMISIYVSKKYIEMPEINNNYSKLIINAIIIFYLVTNIKKTKSLWY
jgi:hypothetical protein